MKLNELSIKIMGHIILCCNKPIGKTNNDIASTGNILKDVMEQEDFTTKHSKYY